MRVFVDSIGLCGPGLPDWPSGRAILAGHRRFEGGPVAPRPSELLPAAERRRMTDAVKIAIAVASESLADLGDDAVSMPSVFASSGGDGGTITAILEALTHPSPEVSPTRFHNSVHNAPSGYWSIAMRSHSASTSLCGRDVSFTVGLLDAAGQVILDCASVLLVSYDLPYPSALHAVRPICAMFGTALVLAPEAGARTIAVLDVSLTDRHVVPTAMAEEGLEALRCGNPAARCLPLLAAIARGDEREIFIPYVAGNILRVLVRPREA